MGASNKPQKQPQPHTLAVRHAHVTPDRFMPAHETIVLEDCTSDDWGQVGRVLATLPRLHSLTVLRCNTHNALLQKLNASRALLQLRIGTADIIQATAASLKEEPRKSSN